MVGIPQWTIEGGPMNAVLNEVVKIRKVLLWFMVTCVVTVVMVTGSGCSVYMAAKQPNEKNLEVFSVGTPRSLVLAEIGQPQASEMKNGTRVDVFSFVQGYSKGAKAGRAFFHGAADVFTLGLWEVVGTPTEAIFTGEKVAYEVTYNASDKVEKVVTLAGEKVPSAAEPTPEGKVQSTKEIEVEPKVEPSQEGVGKKAEKEE